MDLTKSAIEAANITNDSDTTNSSDCWNEYCWTEEEYQNMLEEHIFPRAYEWFFVVLYSVTLTLGLVGNFLVVYAVWRNHTMRTVTNVFIVNLAIGDFLVILVCLPPTLVQDVAQTWYLGTPTCKLLLFIQNMSVSVSVLTLGAISVERWYAICHPLAFKSTLSRARNIIVIIWIVAALVAIPEIVVSQATAFTFPEPFKSVLLTTCAPTWEEWKQVIYQFFLAAGMYLCPLILMTLTYIHIAVVLWKKDIPGEVMKETGKKPMIDGKGSIQEDKVVSRRKAAKMLITIVIVFALCYLPVHLLNILRYFKVLRSTDNAATTTQSLISHLLPYFNSSINPVIYNFMSAKFRKEFKLACFCCLRPFYKTVPRRRDGTFTMTFSNSNYSNCHTEEVTMTSFRD